MAATIKIKNSSTAGAAPTSSDLVQGELAVNVTDKRLYTENASGTIVELGTNPSVPVTFPDGSASAPSLTNDGDTNTGLFFPAADTVGIATGGSERLRLDSSGNLGLGVTPSAWNSVYRSFQIGSTGAISGRTDTTLLELAANAYRNSGGSFIYLTSDLAARYDIAAGVHRWYNAASGTAGNSITFTQAMTLDASGNLGVGTTSPNARITVKAAGTGYTTGALALVGSASGTSYISSIAGSLYFSNNGSTDHMVLDSSGNLLVGATSTLGSTAGVLIAASGANVQTLTTNSTSSSAYYIGRFYSGGTEKGYIYYNGSTVAFTSTSDYRLKENVQPMTGALAKVAQLKPCTYTWKENGQAGQGFIAHELAEVVPDCVSGEKDAVDEDGTPRYQGIDTSFLVATLTAAIQELKAEFDAYKATHP